jgi:hypothetical protein
VKFIPLANTAALHFQRVITTWPNSEILNQKLHTFFFTVLKHYVTRKLSNVRLSLRKYILRETQQFGDRSKNLFSFRFGGGGDRDSSVGIATRYGLDDPGIESRWGRDFPHPFRPALGPTQSCLQWLLGVFSGVKRSGRTVDHPPHLAPRLKKE